MNVMKKPMRWSIVILTVLVMIEGAALVYFIFFHPHTFGFDTKTVRPADNFHFSNDIQCEVVHSTRNPNTGLALDYLDRKNFNINNLLSDNPQMYFGEKKWSDLTKLFESPEYIVLQTTPASWNVETIGIMKENGSFVRTMSGEQAGRWEYHYVVAQKGRCE